MSCGRHSHETFWWNGRVRSKIGCSSRFGTVVCALLTFDFENSPPPFQRCLQENDVNKLVNGMKRAELLWYV